MSESSPKDIKSCLSRQRRHFALGATRSEESRKDALRSLLRVIDRREAAVLQALKKDLGKPAVEAYTSEVALVRDEIRFALKNLDGWMKRERVSTPLAHLPAKSFIYREPLGVVLIIGPWNYPFQLMMAPLIGALAAGNCAVLKCSELAPETAQLIASVVSEAFSPDLVTVFTGGVEVAEALLKERYDHIFFTGGAAVGKKILQAAVPYLTPVTLELGGKSPCIVEESADLEVAARRIVWGKFFNAGQTCVAPDYLLVPEKMLTPFADALARQVKAFFGEDPSKSPDYARIVSVRHFDRLKSLLSSGEVMWGGKSEEEPRYLSPTLIRPKSMDSALMKEEIFGPVLPILPYHDFGDALEQIRSREKPLALYLFSKSKSIRERVLRELSFGGGCINDVLIHLGNPRLPFGGVGESGMGAYHGRYSFELFSHRKSVTERPFWADFSIRYPPYAGKMKILKKILR